jgi:hypothetical protein
MASGANSVADEILSTANAFRIQQLCPSVGEACGVGNFASNLELAMHGIGVDLRTTTSHVDTRIGDLLIQHEFGLFDTLALKATFILAERYIEAPVKRIFNRPIASLNFPKIGRHWVTLCHDNHDRRIDHETTSNI